MDLRRQEEERIGYNPPPLKESATFSRPLLPLNSSLLQQQSQKHQHTSNPTNRVESTHTHTRSLTPSPFNSVSHRHDSTSPVTWHYKECQHNHAANVGGHVIDGCCEFMPGDDVTLKCDACGCHRSFHRKELATNQRATHHPFLTPSSSIDHSSSTEEMQISPNKKRFRTKFTSEQKDRMLEFAERLNWRFQKPDDAAIDDFCKEAGLSRQVFKVWMHNNKYIYNKKQDQEQVITQQEGSHEEPQQQIP